MPLPTYAQVLYDWRDEADLIAHVIEDRFPVQANRLRFMAHGMHNMAQDMPSSGGFDRRRS